MKPIELVNLRKGDILYEQGSNNSDIFLIASGQVVMFHSDKDSRTDCETRGRGSILGALSVMMQSPRFVSAQALEDTCVIRMPAEALLANYDTVDPILRACIDTAICFNARLNTAQASSNTSVPKTGTVVANADALLERLKFEIDLQTSIINREFTMVYQPIVNLQTGKILGFEALMRWIHPVRGFVPPDEFITVAEDLGAIGALTDFAVEESCRTLKNILDQTDGDPDFFASINVSGRDISRLGFAESLALTLDRYGIAPKSIRLEITETACIFDSQIVRDNLEAFKTMGFGLSIDDFGTGYSNLAHFKTMPLSTLKIDRAFAGDAHENPVSGSIVAMLVGLGTALNVDIVAEGVETVHDVRALTNLGCRMAQGYFFHKPTNSNDLLALVSADQGRHPISSVA
ncbi:EAL domain-containing protein [Pseudooctadecabacter jejudonensis]|uniref:Phytochrome-like protein cph2 n=1 Tax=Pseudooctadecabacter jejudonensis TaxID=1391910 RepID=A0A1Y5TAA4_9RHOB|nr:EAL domain-containing protein [Pseudooctadecabacter jejudonensis]SLN59487.1 Phytochrome-like protein cph2 [Pseudooctadecabacter jejudonensis]